MDGAGHTTPLSNAGQGGSLDAMRKTVYIETSIVSYLTAQPSRDLRAAAWQRITEESSNG